MRKIRFLIIFSLVALFILLLSLSGCGNSTPTASSPNTPGSISGMSSSAENKDKSDKEKDKKKKKGEKGDNEAGDGQGASIFPAPATVSATAVSATQINITWSLASGAVGYNIYRSNASAVVISLLNKVNATPALAGPFGNTGLTPSTTYYYVVTSINASGTESAPSTVVNATTIGVPPATPTGVAVSGGTGQNTISWNPSANATSYNLYWSTTPGVTPATGTLIASASSPYIHTGLAAGTTYYYVVTAVNSNGTSAPSLEVSGTTLVAPPAPISATSVGTTQVNVSWTLASGAVGYNIYRSTTPNIAISAANKVNATPVTAGPFGNTGLTPATTYYYVVTSMSAAGVESVASVEVSATTSGLPPAPPTGVVATASVSSNVLSWPAVTGATSYNVYWSTTSGVTPSPATMLASTRTGGYVHTGLTAGTTYYYVITAINANGESLPSVQVSGVPLPLNIGYLYGWGNSNALQFGFGGHLITPTQLFPNLYGTLKKAVTSPYAALALKKDGTVVGWGMNMNGELGLGDYTFRTSPTQILNLVNVMDIALADSHSLILKKDGTVWACGNNFSGQLGDGTNNNNNTFIQVKGLNGVISITAGNNLSMALKNDGTVWAWGDNSQGELGDGTIINASIPVQVTGLSGITAIYANLGFFALALKNDGTIWQWGFNLNRPANTPSIPQQIPSLTGVTKITGCAWNWLALRNDGTVWSGGTSGYSAGQITNLNNVVDVGLGLNYGLAVRNDGTIWTWGTNSVGQLGNGTTVSSTVPVQVPNMIYTVGSSWISVGWETVLMIP